MRSLALLPLLSLLACASLRQETVSGWGTVSNPENGKAGSIDEGGGSPGPVTPFYLVSRSLLGQLENPNVVDGNLTVNGTVCLNPACTVSVSSSAGGALLLASGGAVVKSGSTASLGTATNGWTTMYGATLRNETNSTTALSLFSARTAATATASAPAILLQSTNALDNGDAILDVQNSANTSYFAVREGGAAVFGSTAYAPAWSNPSSGASLLVRSDTGASTATSSIPAIRLQAGAALDANDLILGIQDNSGTNRLTVDLEGDVTGTNITASSALASATHVVSSAALTGVTCSSGTAGYIRNDNTGGTGGVKTKICVCTYDGTTAKWFNILNPTATAGTTTTCPD